MCLERKTDFQELQHPAGIEIEGPDEAGAGAAAFGAVVVAVLVVSDAAPGALTGAGG